MSYVFLFACLSLTLSLIVVFEKKRERTQNWMGRKVGQIWKKLKEKYILFKIFNFLKNENKIIPNCSIWGSIRGRDGNSFKLTSVSSAVFVF